jgi:hypothetical protein
MLLGRRTRREDQLEEMRSPTTVPGTSKRKLPGESTKKTIRFVILEFMFVTPLR